MAEKLIPERGWRPMVDAEKDVMTAIIVLFHEFNKPTGPLRVQFARWMPNSSGEWAWRPAWKPDQTVYCDSFMMPDEYQRACEELASEGAPEFDL